MITVPFSPPRIDQKIIDKVTEVLNSGWITTGPVTKQFEKDIANYLDLDKVLCLNSWTNAAELFLNWYGISKGDEVLLPAYTYAASCNIIFHLGATPVLVDCEPGGFNLCVDDLAKKITTKTKCIIPVDIAGLPCDYDKIRSVIESTKHLFSPKNDNEKALGRILLFSDSAHSFGSTKDAKHTAHFSDAACYSFHAVKNLTTAEGGALAFNLPKGFNHEDIYKELNIMSLHGQTKDALSKTNSGSWKYDITSAGFKCNMTDLHAAIGAIELERYNDDTLAKRAQICEHYHDGFSNESWYLAPVFKSERVQSSYHLFQLRINGFGENERDRLIQELKEKGVSTNVHFTPLPLFSFYQKQGFDMTDYPNAYDAFKNEVSLPVFYDLTTEQQNHVISSIKSIVNSILNA